MKIIIDKNTRIPIYKQIVDHVTTLKSCGVYQPGEKLPTERELASFYDIARGTVKRAYDKLLKSGVITVIQGKGTFIKDNNGNDNNNHQTIDIIDDYLDQLTDLSLSLDDIEMYIVQKLKERGENRQTMQVAVVECCPESICEVMKSLVAFQGIEITGILLNKVVEDPKILLDNYSLIIIADLHAPIVESILPSIKDKLIHVALSINPLILKEIAAIPHKDKIGIFCRSKRYSETMTGELTSLDPNIQIDGIFFSDSKDSFQAFLANKHTLIAADSYESFSSHYQKEELSRFILRGGKLISFNFTLDIGSSMYVEDSIRKYRAENYDMML